MAGKVWDGGSWELSRVFGVEHKKVIIYPFLQGLARSFDMSEIYFKSWLLQFLCAIEVKFLGIPSTADILIFLMQKVHSCSTFQCKKLFNNGDRDVPLSNIISLEQTNPNYSW